jgi:hypothetical protein
VVVFAEFFEHLRQLFGGQGITIDISLQCDDVALRYALKALGIVPPKTSDSVRLFSVHDTADDFDATE